VLWLAGSDGNPQTAASADPDTVCLPAVERCVLGNLSSMMCANGCLWRHDCAHAGSAPDAGRRARSRCTRPPASAPACCGTTRRCSRCCAAPAMSLPPSPGTHTGCRPKPYNCTPHAGHLLPNTTVPSSAAFLCVRARCGLAWRRRGRGVNMFCTEWGRAREAVPR